MNFLSETFKNGVVVVNTTPHSVTLQDIGGTLKQVPQCGVLVNAKAVETQVNDTCTYLPAFVATRPASRPSLALSVGLKRLKTQVNVW